MYLMMQYADMGEVSSWSETEKKYVTNQRVVDHLTRKLTEDPEFAQFGAADCATMKERVARFIFTQVANGLEYLHEEALVANRDLKPENILFTTKEGGTNIYSHDRAQITDFTTVFKLTKETADQEMISGLQGTAAFMAPECSLRPEYKPRPLDVWAFGVSLYVYMFEELPFWGDTPDQITTEIETKVLNYDGREISDGLKELLMALLEKNPDLRPSIREAKERYSWLRRPVFESEKPPPDDDLE